MSSLDRARSDAISRHDHFRISWVSAALCIFLITSCLKDDLSIILDDFGFSGLTINPVILLLKDNTSILYAIVLSVFVIRLVKARFLFNPDAAPLVLLSSVILWYIAVRSLLYEWQPKFIGSAIIVTAIFAFVSTVSKEKRSFMPAAIVSGFLQFSYIFILANIVNLALGYGYVPGVSRLFGTASHPNFLAAQSAIAANCLIFILISGKSRSYRVINGVFLCAALVLIALSGSRTGVIMVAAGLITMLLRGKSVYMTVLTLAVATAIVFFVVDDDVISPFSRGGENTRAEAWSYLIGTIENNVLFGVGGFRGASESSFLRAWAAFGLPAFLGIIYLGVRAVITSFSSEPLPNGILASGLVVSLLCGGMTEGFLVDSFSLPMIAWQLALYLAQPQGRLSSAR